MKKGFTLVELLVVIAIIAVLAGILFPVFAQARAAAQKTQSLSNLKAISLGMLIYTADNSDYLPPSTSYTSDGRKPCNVIIKWQDAIHPYVKSGRGQLLKNQGGSFDEGVYKSPGGKKQLGSNYAVHQDVFMDHYLHPGNSCYSPHPTFSQLDYQTFDPQTFDSFSQKVMLVERGNSGVASSFLVFGAWQWDWAVWGWDEATGKMQFDEEGDIRSTPEFPRDCDETFSEYLLYNGCDMFPRYRYSNQSPFAFFDGHVKTMSRSEDRGPNATSQVDWVKNIYIPEAIRPTWKGSYPY